MKRILLLLLLLPAMVSAAQVTITVPPAVVAQVGNICDKLRIELHIRTADWSTEACAETFTRYGVRTYVERVERRSQQQTIDSAVQAEIDLFDVNWPRIEPVRCGDSTTDAEYGEECDDGNTTSGDGCDERCRNE